MTRASFAAGDRMNLPSSVRLLLLSSLVGRLHSTVIALVLTLAVQEWTDSFVLGGLALGALTFGQAISGPRRGRAIDRAATRSLLLCAVGYSIGLMSIGAVVAFGSPSLWPVVTISCLLTGLLLPAVAPAVRVAMPRMIPPNLIQRALTVEAAAQEIIFLGGPALAVLALSLWAPTGVLVATGLVAGAGVLFFVAVHNAVAPTAPWRAVTSRTRSALNPPTRLLTDASANLRSLFAIHALVLCSLTAMTVTLVASATCRGEPHAAGWLEASIAAGSLVGGWCASQGWLNDLRLLGRLGGMTLGTACIVFATAADLDLPWLAISLSFAGFWLAPILALQNALVLDVAEKGRAGEAFSWGGAITLTAVSAVAPAIGLALDVFGPVGGALLALGLVASATVLARNGSL